MSISRRSTLGFASALAALAGSPETALATALKAAPRIARYRNLATAQRFLIPLIHKDESRHQPHAAMIWLPSRDTAWYAIDTMEAGTYSRLNRAYKKRGYRLERIGAFKTRAGTRYAAIWELTSGPEWHSRHGMTLAEFNRARADFAGRGRRMTHIDSHAGYSAIWEHGGAAAQQCLAAVSADEFATQMATLQGQGFRPLRISTGVVQAAPSFTAIFEKDASVVWHAEHAMTAPAFEKTQTQMSAQGFKLVDASGQMVGKQPSFSGIWEKI
jgi:Bacterial tandem repeat domain 1